jgi:hypothetical protein
VTLEWGAVEAQRTMSAPTDREIGANHHLTSWPILLKKSDFHRFKNSRFSLPGYLHRVCFADGRRHTDVVMM